MEFITVLTGEQLQDCLGVRRKVFVEEQNVPEELEVDEFDASPRACCHVLVKEGDKHVAAGRFREYKPGTAKLQRVAVLPEYRGLGLGRRLIGELEARARAAGFATVILDGQCHAESFYRKLGYETISKEPFLDAGIWHVRMQKSLIE